MNTFFKTFFVCLVLTFCFLAYKYFAQDGYNSDLEISKNNPVFGVHKETPQEQKVKKENPNNESEIQTNPVKKPDKPAVPAVEKKVQTNKTVCYFYSYNGQLTKVERQINAKPSLENAISMLLKGPMISEAKKGIYTEIPSNVDLISLKRQNGSIIVNLSSNFGNGGGSQSVENRVKQLSKTIKTYAPNKNIYLYINGNEVEYLGGDGVYIKQPLD